ncbi:MAG: GspH/FimT family pseudopilin [Desulfobacterales bacterium]|nr:MAG: GspH/FimT family pseudopilin [Desulfobacterales bacterium]
MMRKNSGFTVIELMVTIAIVAILAGLAVPGFVGWLPNYRLRSGAEEIQSTLQLARIRAIKQNATATVSFDMANETYQASVDGQAFQSGRMPAGVVIDSVSGTAEFGTRGFAASPVDIRLKNSLGKSKTITVKLTGNSRID